MSKIEKVHVVFKTHLDIGFTDLASSVLQQYLQLYIPQAITLAEHLEKEGGVARFVWTTGSWLIYEYLKRANDPQREGMERAIESGHIAWHGLPFTTHTELLDPSLFDYGLSIAENLNVRFGKQTLAAKMTDVPGHTRAIIPHMAKRGIQYLHLGVNPASKVPEVPGIFIWRGQDGSEIIVNYADNYGNILVLDGLKEALVFAHTGDNCGPPSAEDIKKEFEDLSKRFPHAEIRASTLDAFAAVLLPLKGLLPVVYEEIGDTWIHGAATDPKKISQYRALLRLRNQWLGEKRFDLGSKEYRDFSDSLLLIAEHTWGMDEKKWLTDYKHYAKADFNAARKASSIFIDAVPEKYKYIGAFAMNEFDALSKGLYTDKKLMKSFSMFEQSWQEQRNYVIQALDALSEDKKLEALSALDEMEPCKVHETGDTRAILPWIPQKLGEFIVEFSEEGAIVGLRDLNKKEWADKSHRIGAFLYETIGVENYNTWFEQYVENIDQTHAWADADFGKPGMENVKPKPENKCFKPILISLTCKNEDAIDHVIAILEMPEASVLEYGAPRRLSIEYRFFTGLPNRIEIELCWKDKEANRLPEAAWFTFTPKVNNANLWKMDKLGELISPLDVVKNGNRNMHAVNKGIYYHGADGIVSIETLDAPVVAVGERKILNYDNQVAPLENGFHFLLYNNVWGTNFPMWYEEDAKFRFSVSF